MEDGAIMCQLMRNASSFMAASWKYSTHWTAPARVSSKKLAVGNSTGLKPEIIYTSKSWNYKSEMTWNNKGCGNNKAALNALVCFGAKGARGHKEWNRSLGVYSQPWNSKSGQDKPNEMMAIRNMFIAGNWKATCSCAGNNKQKPFRSHEPECIF